MKSIGSNSFKDSKLKVIDLSKCTRLRKIEPYVFYDSKLKELDLSKCTKLESIGRGCFANSMLNSMDLRTCLNLSHLGNNSFGPEVQDLIIPNGFCLTHFLELITTMEQ